jgi:hypothetical protein
MQGTIIQGKTPVGDTSSKHCIVVLRTQAECDDAVVIGCRSHGYELQIFRLPGKGGYSTRPLGTTSSLIIWVESYFASVTLQYLQMISCEFLRRMFPSNDGSVCLAQLNVWNATGPLIILYTRVIPTLEESTTAGREDFSQRTTLAIIGFINKIVVCLEGYYSVDLYLLSTSKTMRAYISNSQLTSYN